MEIVRAALAAVNRGDLDAAFKDAAPGGEWETIRRRVLARDMGYCYLCDELGAT